MKVLRFAPAPTGDLHIGHLWICFLNQQIAGEGDRLILRVDDTNVDLNKAKSFERRVLKACRWFGLRFTESRLQSDFKSRHRDFMFLRLKDVFLEDGAWKLRLKEGRLKFRDEVRGRDLDKFYEEISIVLLKSDGDPTYHLASIADDVEDGVSDLIRASDHLDNTFLHSRIFASLGHRPRYWLCPLIYDSKGAKLSKSLGNAPTVDWLRQEGFPAKALRLYFEAHLNKDGLPNSRPFNFDLKRLKVFSRNYLVGLDDGSLLEEFKAWHRWTCQPLTGTLELFYLVTRDRGFHCLRQAYMENSDLLTRLQDLKSRWLKGSLPRFWRDFLNQLSLLDYNELVLIENLPASRKSEFRNLLGMTSAPSFITLSRLFKKL